MSQSQQDLTDVTIQQYDPVRIGQQSQLRCVYTGSDLELQLITWSKIYNGGTSSFVYEYDACAGTSKAFNELAGRATMSVVKPVDQTNNRILDINAQKRKPRDVSSVIGKQKDTSLKDDAQEDNSLDGEGLKVVTKVKDGIQENKTSSHREKRELHDLMKTLTGMMEGNTGNRGHTKHHHRRVVSFKLLLFCL